MMDHWQAVVTAAIVGVMAILTRYLFVMKKDCKEHRDNCNRTICGKINDLQNRASAATIQAVVLDNEAKATLKEINIAILELNKSMSEMKGTLSQFIHEFDKHQQ